MTCQVTDGGCHSPSSLAHSVEGGNGLRLVNWLVGAVYWGPANWSRWLWQALTRRLK